MANETGLFLDVVNDENNLNSSFNSTAKMGNNGFSWCKKRNFDLRK
jgi:hypothetical protein